MRLRASFTVENSFIIPFFTMIIVVMVILALDMHDELIGKAVSFQGNMKIEQEKVPYTPQLVFSLIRPSLFDGE